MFNYIDTKLTQINEGEKTRMTTASPKNLELKKRTKLVIEQMFSCHNKEKKERENVKT